MDLQITGRVLQLLEEQSGTSRNGPWRKKEFILETEGQYPKQVCIVQWGDDIDRFGIEEGERLTAHIDIQSREYKGRWYTDVKAWRIQKEGGGEAPPEYPVDEAPPADAGPGLDDDLPF